MLKCSCRIKEGIYKQWTNRSNATIKNKSYTVTWEKMFMHCIPWLMGILFAKVDIVDHDSRLRICDFSYLLMFSCWWSLVDMSRAANNVSLPVCLIPLMLSKAMLWLVAAQSVNKHPFCSLFSASFFVYLYCLVVL